MIRYVLGAALIVGAHHRLRRGPCQHGNEIRREVDVRSSSSPILAFVNRDTVLPERSRRVRKPHAYG